MAKIHEELVVIKFSKLTRETQPTDSVITSEISAALEQVAQELVGEGVIVEVETAD